MTADLKVDTPESVFLESLKAQTAEAHRQLERLEVSRSLMDEAIDENTYAHYLSLMLDVNKSLETRVFPEIGVLIKDVDRRRKSPWLEQDLQLLGKPVEAGSEVFGTGPFGLAFSMGIAYVVEGSTLGGRYILAHLNGRLPSKFAAATRYFDGYGTKTGKMWKEFVQSLADFAVENNTGQTIIEGANFAFMAIRKHLNRHEDPRHRQS